MTLFHCYKDPIFLNDVGINNIIVSNKISSGKKHYEYFIDYVDEYKIKSFTIILPKTTAFVKSYDGGATKWMYFLIEDE